MAHVNLDSILASVAPPELSVEVGGVTYHLRRLSIAEVRSLCFGASLSRDEAERLVNEVVISEPKPPLDQWAASEQPLLEAFTRVLISHAEAVLAKKLDAVATITKTILTTTTATGHPATGHAVTDSSDS